MRLLEVVEALKWMRILEKLIEFPPLRLTFTVSLILFLTGLTKIYTYSERENFHYILQMW